MGFHVVALQYSEGKEAMSFQRSDILVQRRRSPKSQRHNRRAPHTRNAPIPEPKETFAGRFFALPPLMRRMDV
jgi:hypothetical protein